MSKIFLIALFAVLTVEAAGQDVGSIEMVTCFLEDCSQQEDYPHVAFGYVRVPMSYDDPEGEQVKVAFTLIKSQQPDSKPDPIIIFGGGWGIPSLGSTFSMAENFPVKNRDLLFFDYRGSGYSEPSLCPGLDEKLWDVLRADFSYEQFFDRVNTLSYDCLAQIEGRDLDYRRFGTAVKTKDAVILAELLGYKEVNLFGISNGTMAIQGFLKAVAGSPVNVRSILSDSNVPMVTYNRARITSDYKNVLDSIMDDCAENPSCDEAFPELKERFYSFLRNPEFTPIVYRGVSSIVFNKYEINSLIHQLLYAWQSYKDIPLLLEAIMERRMDFIDQLYSPLKQRVAGLNGTSIINYEYDWKFTQETVRKTYQEDHSKIAEFALADFWMDFALRDTTLDYHSPDTAAVFSDVPALILAGTYDPITPPSQSEVMHQRYANSYYLEFPGIGHGVINVPCAKELYHRFLENPGVEPDSDCLQQLAEAEIPFTTGYIPNQKVSGLLMGILQHQDILLIAAVAVPFIMALILFLREAMMWFRRKNPDFLILTLSGCIIIFIVALGIYLYQTVSMGGLFILLGLVGEAVWLPWMALIVLILALAVLVTTIRDRKPLFWNLAACFSATIIVWLSMRFELFVL